MQIAGNPEPLVVVAENVGLFTWDVIGDRLRGDEDIAAFFGLPKQAVAEGLGVAHYLARIVLEDRDRVAAAIHNAIIGGGRYQAVYRVAQPDGHIISLTAVGRCFFDEDGDPVQYCGIIFESPDYASAAEDNILGELCRAAYKQASGVGDARVAGLLEPVLEALGLPVPGQRAGFPAGASASVLDFPAGRHQDNPRGAAD